MVPSNRHKGGDKLISEVRIVVELKSSKRDLLAFFDKLLTENTAVKRVHTIEVKKY